MHWHARDYSFGTGLVAQAENTVYELIPYVSEDGSGDVAGWGLWTDGRNQVRLRGSIDRCRFQAERIIAERCEPREGAA